LEKAYTSTFGSITSLEIETGHFHEYRVFRT
jgi:hypothetical protein